MRWYGRIAHAIFEHAHATEGSFDNPSKLDMVLVAISFGVSEDRIWANIKDSKQRSDLRHRVPSENARQSDPGNRPGRVERPGWLRRQWPHLDELTRCSRLSRH